MIYHMPGLLPYLVTKIHYFLENSLFSIDYWHVQRAISPLVPWQLVAHFVKTGLIFQQNGHYKHHTNTLIMMYHQCHVPRIVFSLHSSFFLTFIVWRHTHRATLTDEMQTNNQYEQVISRQQIQQLWQCYIHLKTFTWFLLSASTTIAS